MLTPADVVDCQDLDAKDAVIQLGVQLAVAQPIGVLEIDAPFSETRQHLPQLRPEIVVAE